MNPLLPLAAALLALAPHAAATETQAGPDDPAPPARASDEDAAVHALPAFGVALALAVAGAAAVTRAMRLSP